ncbi:hypothetical protein [Virgibacillus pantothenticus]|uniref:hypothetical protein n=1 Tax=Virgibacillus pantothenticus TaxID=1473 RepID=UPI00098428D5|nr:hypothetical protein [Virgibacillus pantothenticus]
MKKKIHIGVFALLTSIVFATSVSAGYSQVNLTYLDTKSGSSTPIHNGSVLGTAHHLENHVTGSGYVRLTVKKHLVGGIHPTVLEVRSTNGLKTGRAKVDPSNYYPRGQTGLARGYVSISGS